MDNFKKKLSENKLNLLEEKIDDYLGFEFTIGDLDIEKQMTEFTFKQVISWINIKLITWNNFG